MQPVFATDYTTILGRIDAIDPMKYGRTRNFVDGDVSYLSPYISRGVISTKQVLDHVMLKGYKIPQIESFVKELCWRDYFQRVGQVKNLNQDNWINIFSKANKAGARTCEYLGAMEAFKNLNNSIFN